MKQRTQGESNVFFLYRNNANQIAMTSREKIIWQSIKHLCASEIAENLLRNEYNIKTKTDIKSIIKSFKNHISQSYEFFEIAKGAKSVTAPLFYYYSFLNMSKALISLKFPKFHKENEYYHHGISWKPNKDFLVNMEKEYVSITTRGIWQTLYDIQLGENIKFRNLINIKIKDLFSFLPQLCIEFERTFYTNNKLISIDNISIITDELKENAIIQFSIFKDVLLDQKLTRSNFCKLINNSKISFSEVESNIENALMFESTSSKNIPKNYEDNYYNLFESEIKQLFLFYHPDIDQNEYYFSNQQKIPIKLTQLQSLYTVVFWLGSLVRYDPYSLNELQDSKYWILIDGFLNQCIISMLELFEWEFYQRETVTITI